MPRYAILLHETPPNYPRPTHWDFMLEEGSSLLTWALASELTFDHSISAERLADHRLAYLEFEGPVSEGRGRVTQWDTGHFEWVQRCENQITVFLNGKRCRGLVTLTREGIEDRGEADLQRWSVSLRKS